MKKAFKIVLKISTKSWGKKMAITNEATIRVRIDGADAEVSIQDLGKIIQKTMEQGKASADKLKSSFQKIGDFSQRLFFTFRSFGMVINQVSRLSSMALKAGSEAGASAESYRKFSDSVERLKIQGGRLINVFLMPVMELTSKFVGWIESLNQKSVLMVGTIGMAGIAVAKLIPLLRTLGITSKAALGWIGVIITGIMSLYAAWATNTWGMREKLTGFWYFVEGWAEQLGKTLTALGNIIKGVFDRSWSAITEGWKGLKESFKWDIVAAWKDAFAKAKAEADKFVPVAKKTGEVIGAAFSEGFESGIIDKEAKGERKSWRKFDKEMRSLTKAMKKLRSWEFDEEDDAEAETKEDPFEAWKDSLKDTALTAKDVFGTIGTAVSSLSERLTAAIFGAKIKLKDLWTSMAQDFVVLFIEEILKQIALKLVTGILALLALFDKRENDLMAIRVGRDYARFFSQGVFQGLNPQMLAGNMAGMGSFNDANIVSAINSTNTKLTALANNRPVVNNNISGRQLYDTVKWQRNKELMRRGRDVNNELF